MARFNKDFGKIDGGDVSQRYEDVSQRQIESATEKVNNIHVSGYMRDTKNTKSVVCKSTSKRCKSNWKPLILGAINRGYTLSFEIADYVGGNLNNVQRLLTHYTPRYVIHSGKRGGWYEYDLTEEGTRYLVWWLEK